MSFLAYTDTGVVPVNPCELNTLVAAITNHLYSTLSKEDFRCLNVFVSELGKSMFAMTLFGEICDRDDKHRK